MVVDCWGTGAEQTAVGPACNMADSFLQGAEIGGGLVARAMEQRRQNALLPLQIQEAQDQLHLNALKFEQAQHNRDIEIEVQTGTKEVAAWAANVKDWAAPETVSGFLGLAQKYPMAIQSPAAQFAEKAMTTAQAAKQKQLAIDAATKRAQDAAAARVEESIVRYKTNLAKIVADAAKAGDKAKAKVEPQVYKSVVPGKGTAYLTKGGAIIDPKKFMSGEDLAETKMLETQLTELGKAKANTSDTKKLKVMDDQAKEILGKIKQLHADAMDKMEKLAPGTIQDLGTAETSPATATPKPFKPGGVIKTKAEYDALPSGTEFTDPAGKKWKKP